MTETERKALALLNEHSDYEVIDLDKAQYSTAIQALCHAIEQHEQFKREVSDTVDAAKRTYGGHRQAFDQLERFIIPKPDPLVDAFASIGTLEPKYAADNLRAALAARGLEVRKIGEGE